MRGQAVTISTLSWIVLIFLFLTFIFILGLQVFRIVTTAQDAEKLVQAVDRIYGLAESLPPGSTQEQTFVIPKGVSAAQVVSAPDGKWELRLTYNGELQRRVSYTKVLYLPENLLTLDGLHRVTIRKESEYSAIVEEQQR